MEGPSAPAAATTATHHHHYQQQQLHDATSTTPINTWSSSATLPHQHHLNRNAPVLHQNNFNYQVSSWVECVVPGTRTSTVPQWLQLPGLLLGRVRSTWNTRRRCTTVTSTTRKLMGRVHSTWNTRRHCTTVTSTTRKLMGRVRSTWNTHRHCTSVTSTTRSVGIRHTAGTSCPHCRMWLTWLDEIKWLWTFRPTRLFRAHCASFHVHSFLLAFFSCLSYFNLAVPMRKYSGEYSRMSSTFPIAILNGTYSFWNIQP